MKKSVFLILLLCLYSAGLRAQFDREVTDREIGRVADGREGRRRIVSDSVQSQHKIVPRGLKTWTVDGLFGDMTPVEPDTLSYMFMNTCFTTGVFGDYNTTGNLGAPRINRIFIDRPESNQFIFADPYDFFITSPEDLHFTQTYSPLTNLTYMSCGDRLTGEDDLRARFAVNAGKKLGVGFDFKYLYGRGYYNAQSTSHLGYTLYGSYRGDRYQAHFIGKWNHQKVGENGGIVDDTYVTHPERYADDFDEDEIPTILERNWNRNDNQRVFFTHRYSVGFSRRVPLTEEERKAREFAIEAERESNEMRELDEAQKEAKREGRVFNEEEWRRQRRMEGRPQDAVVTDELTSDDNTSKGGGRVTLNSVAAADSLNNLLKFSKADSVWTKMEYVPVTSFIHTLDFQRYRRIYQAYETPVDFYANEYYNVGKYAGDSIFDKTNHYELSNTFAIALMEGFNKWAKAGIKAFVRHDFRRFTLPDGIGGVEKWKESALHVGGSLSKRQGRTLHYNVTADFGIVGDDAGEVEVDGNIDLNIPFLRDTLSIEAEGFFRRIHPHFYMHHWHSRHVWWDNDEIDAMTHSRISGILLYPRTGTKLRLAFDRMTNYTYLTHSYIRNADLTHTANDVRVMQHGSAITLLTLQLHQQLKLGPVHWDNIVTFQKSSKEEVLGVPLLNLYSNLFVRFRIARVLNCDFGVDARYFTKYYAPSYIPMMGVYGVGEVLHADQGRTDYVQEKVGGHIYANVYANFYLKYLRFFVILSHVNADLGSRNYFMTPHYPQNSRVLRLGLSWNLFN